MPRRDAHPPGHRTLASPSASVEDRVLAACGATAVVRAGRLQSVWSGYGELVRYEVVGGEVPSVVVKSVTPPARQGLGHARKLRSYDVELAWYRALAARLPPPCRVARCLLAERRGGTWLFVLEDLDAAGFSRRTHHPSPRELRGCLRWLAWFHAVGLVQRAQGSGVAERTEKRRSQLGPPPLTPLERGSPSPAPDQQASQPPIWPTGTYWHLATRPDELAALPAGPLRDAAPLIDARLRGARWQTWVHGDAKPANFCFRPRAQGGAPDAADAHGQPVAAVDFQYVGGGVGVQDVAYLVRGAAQADVDAALETYLAQLADALGQLDAARAGVDAAAVVAEWRALLPWAWADYHRFVAGWAPGFQAQAHEQAMTDAVVAQALGER